MTMQEERRPVTAFFADLAGSTALTESLDAEEARLIIRESITHIIEAVERYGGHIKDLAGDGVLAFFGAPTAHEDDPERAARAAIEATRAVAADALRVQSAYGVVGLAVRIGIDTGEVVVGEVGAGSRTEYGATGDAVNRSARLQSSAAPGTVMVTARTRQLLTDQFVWGEEQKLELKGLSQPVLAYQLVGMESESGAPIEHTPIVGREREVGELARISQECVSGSGALIFMVGEPGIGKSRLAAELRHIADEAGIRWMEGRCASYGEALSYWPYRDLLRTWLHVGPLDPELRQRIALKRQLAELLGDNGESAYPYLATMLGLNLEGDAQARLAGMTPEAVQFQTFEVMRGLVSALCAREPVAIFIDDLHWADHTSLALTQSLAGLVETQPLLIVMAMRPEVDTAAWTFKENVAREFRHVIHEIELRSLSSGDTELLIRELQGDWTVPEPTRARISEYAGGNPLYIEEIVRSIIESAEGEVSVPRTLEGVILARIDRLGSELRTVITSASVLDRNFEFDILQAVTGQDEGSLRDALHDLLRAGLLLRAGQAYRFKHALIQDAAYNTLVKERRRALHRAVAENLERRYADNPQRIHGLLARHWLLAEEPHKAAFHARKAGDRAVDEWALDEAAKHYRALLPLLEATGDAAGVAEALFKLATILHLDMRFGEAARTWAEGLAHWTAPSPPAAPPSASLRIACNQIPWDADPGTGYFATNLALYFQLYDCLLTMRPDPYVVPGLATSWTVTDDGLVYRLKLREGVAWSDGQPITAHQVVYAYQQEVDPAHPGGDAPMMFAIAGAEARLRGDIGADEIGVRAISDTEIEFRLHQACPWFIFLWTDPPFGPRRPDLQTSGAFRLVTMNEKSVVIERDPSYARGRGGNIARAEWVLTSGTEAARAARADEIDVVWGNLVLDDDPGSCGLVAQTSALTMSVFVAFTGRGELVLPPKVRRALALAVDRDSIAVGLPYRLKAAHGGLVPPGIPGHTPDIALPHDPELAAHLVKESGFDQPIRMVISQEQRLPYMEELMDGWRRAGLAVEPVIRPMAANADIEWRTQQHLAIWHWVAHVFDAEYFLLNLLHGSSPSRIAGWSSAEFDRLVDGALAATDGATRLARLHAADRFAVTEELFLLPIAYGWAGRLLKPWVHGWWQWGAPGQSYDEIVVDESSPRYRG